MCIIPYVYVLVTSAFACRAGCERLHVLSSCAAGKFLVFWRISSMPILQRNTHSVRAHALLSRLQGALRYVFTIRDEGVRTALATVLPVVVGQMTHYPIVGLMMGLGGLYVCVAEKGGATLRTLLLATVLVALFALFGTAAGGSLWLSVGLMFVVAFGGGMWAVYGVLPGQLGFVAMLVFAVALGIPGPLLTAEQRGLEFGAGGLLATLLTLALWRIRANTRHRKANGASDNEDAAPEQRGKGEDKQQKGRNRRTHGISHQTFARKITRRVRKLRRNLTLRSEVCQHALRLAVISAFAVWLYKHLHLEHGSWLTITVLVIVKPDYHDTRTRAKERVVGTVIGGILALILASTIHSVAVADIMLLLLCVLAFSHQPQNYALYAAFLTPFVVLLLQLAAPGTANLAFARVMDTLLGGALALFAAFLMRPRSRRKATT